MKKYIFLSVFVSILLGYIPLSHSMDQEERRPPNIKMQYKVALEERIRKKRDELEEERTQNPNKAKRMKEMFAGLQMVLQNPEMAPQEDLIQKFSNL